MLRKYIISLSGIDGCGKTTQSKILYRLVKRSYKRTYLIQYKTYDPFKKIINMGVKQRLHLEKQYSLARRSIKYRINFFLKNIAYYILWILNDIVFSYNLRRILRHVDVVVMDRTPFIDGVCLLGLRKVNLKPYIRLIRFLYRWIFRVDRCRVIAIVLDIDPVITLSRRKEHSLYRQVLLKTYILGVAKKFYKLYRCSSNGFSIRVVDVSHKSIEQVSSILWGIVSRELRVNGG